METRPRPIRLLPYTRLNTSQSWYDFDIPTLFQAKSRLADGHELTCATDGIAGDIVWVEFNTAVGPSTGWADGPAEQVSPNSPLGRAFPDIEYRYLKRREVTPDRAMAWCQYHGLAVPRVLEDQLAQRNEASADGSAARPANGAVAAPVRVRNGELSPASKAIAAAYDLKKAGKLMSLTAVCRLARVDRNNLRQRFPDIIGIIQEMAAPDRTPRRGVRDKRTGMTNAIDDGDPNGDLDG